MPLRIFPALLFLGVVTAGPLLAAPMDEAKALLASKQYDQVDGVLEKELSQRTPAIEALKVSMDAALASGRLVTAEKRAAAILKQAQEPAMLYAGAELAEEVGDSRMALTRYLAYARQENQKTDKLEKALAYVLAREAYPDEYRKYVTTFGVSARAWVLGASQLNRLLETPDPDKALEIADFLMQQFPAPADVSAVHQILRTGGRWVRVRQRSQGPVSAATSSDGQVSGR